MKQRLLEMLQEKSTWLAIASIVSFLLNKYYGFADVEAVTTIILGINSLYLVWVKEHKKEK
jgi:hypothetical protein